MKTFILFSIVVALFIPTVKSCKDDPNYMFTLYWDNVTRVKCVWLTKNDSQIYQRKADYCPRVKQFCPVSCDNCTTAPTRSPLRAPTKGPTIAPFPAPTKSPTKAPTKAPVKSPTSPPTGAPTGPCADSTEYQFENGNDDPVNVDCAWMTKNYKQKDRRISRWCSETNVGFACPLTCGTCTTTCADDATYKFTLINKKVKFCSWISSNAVKLDIRRKMYCNDHGDRCPEACGYCI